MKAEPVAWLDDQSTLALPLGYTAGQNAGAFHLLALTAWKPAVVNNGSAYVHRHDGSVCRATVAGAPKGCQVGGRLGHVDV